MKRVCVVVCLLYVIRCLVISHKYKQYLKGFTWIFVVFVDCTIIVIIVIIVVVDTNLLVVKYKQQYNIIFEKQMDKKIYIS